MENMTAPAKGVFFKDLELGTIFDYYGWRCIKVVNNEYGWTGELESSDYLVLNLKTFEIASPSPNDICYPIDTLVGKYNQS